MNWQDYISMWFIPISMVILLIVSLVMIYIITVWQHPRPNTPPQPPQPIAPSQPPQPKAPIQSKPNGGCAWFLMKWGCLGFVLAMFFITFSCSYFFVNKAKEHWQENQKEALVLMHECYTPCSADIQWKFRIHTDGHALKIKFQGVSQWFDHPEKGDVEAPVGTQMGETQFVSADPKNPKVRVQVYKKITVPGGR